MLDKWIRLFCRKTCLAFIIVLFFTTLYFYTTIVHNLRERQKFIKNYDEDNFSHYFLSDNAVNFEIQQYVVDVQKIINMKKEVVKLNQNLNVPTNDKTIKKVPLVIVVQVHDKLPYLLELLKSMQNVLGIMNTIVIFSHDFYDKEINDLISRVQFVTTFQIFYPYSKQLHPNVFPGDDKTYCGDGWRCRKAMPDERDSSLTQMKNHWWWQVNYVFDQLNLLKNYNDLVVFLEEDQFVAEDFLYVIKILNLARKSSCHRCDILSVGAYPPLLSKYNVNSTLLVEEFGTTPFSMGIAFNRTTWNRIKALRHHFCYYDDYDWVSSLRFLSSRLPEGRLNMLSIVGARVIHIGTCGVHEDQNNKRCNVTGKIKILEDFMKLVKKQLFPKHFVIKSNKRYTKVKKAGYFNDVRDHELCMYFTKDK